MGVRIIGRFDTKSEAQAVETVLINWVYGIGGLTNISRGRGAGFVRPVALADQEMPGLDIERTVRVYGGGRVNNMGYLAKKIENHEKNDHFSMALVITDHLRTTLRATHPGLTVEDPCFWESGRYIGIFVNLVPNAVRMIIQLTDSENNQHVYNLCPMSQSTVARTAFSAVMNEYAPNINVMNHGSYAKLEEWKRLTVLNSNLYEISMQVMAALKFFQERPHI